jgi:hypothetical protein
MTYQLMYSNVPAQFVPTDNYDRMQGATRLKQNNIQTSDYIHFQSDQEIGEGWVIYIRPESVRIPNSWSVSLGAPEKHQYRAKYLRVYLNNQLPLRSDQIV